MASPGALDVMFNIHVNGVLHCRVRYSQLDKFNDQLKKEFHDKVPSKEFPGKKLFSLSPDQLEERRLMLERYIQIISQDADIGVSETFNDFFLKAQQETRHAEPEEVSLEIYLMNGNKVSVAVLSTDQTDDVLETTMRKINLSDKFVYYFALYLVKPSEDGGIILVRKLQDFESPYLSLKATKQPHRIVIRKSYWSKKYDSDLFEDRIALNLLYVQVVDDIERGWVITSEIERERLSRLKQSNSRKEYVKVARSLKYYGYLQFKSCMVDYPRENSRALFAAGEKEFNMRVQTEVNKIMEGNFQVSRIRSWRISSLDMNTVAKFLSLGVITCETDNKIEENTDEELEFAFEYLFSKDSLKWVTVISEQGIMMSMCMQGMVDEIIRELNKKPIKVPKPRVKKTNSLLDQSQSPAKTTPKKQVSVVSSSESDASTTTNGTPATAVKKISASTTTNGTPATAVKKISASTTTNGTPTTAVKKISGKVQGLLGKKSAGVNEVFAHEDIGDDDL